MERAEHRRDAGDPYGVLGVSAGASQRDIARAYRRAVQHAHPDAQPHDSQAAARFQALTNAYDLLRDPARRAGYDRSHPTREPSGQPAQSRQPAPPSRGRGSPFLLGPPSGRLIWAGPVQVEPPPTAPATSQHRSGAAAAEFDDPVVILGVLPGRLWGWPW